VPLIPSSRHTPADLALWRDLEGADRAHGRSAGLVRKVDRSTEAIRGFLAAGPAYLSVSWGKDSVVLAHLGLTVAPRLPLIHLRAVPHGNPDTPAVRDAFLTRYPGTDYRELAVDYRDIPPGLGPDVIEREKDRRFFATFPGGRYLSGIRADESAGRKVRMRKWGLRGPTTAAPLGWWTAADVFAFLATEGLPVHSTYSMLGAGRWDREHVRVDELGGARGNQFGRKEWELLYYGDFLRRIEAVRPV
jgi:phosphoadenosine phosphosulfate reductase